MCGRFTFQPTEVVYARFEISHRLDSLTARYNIAPGQMVLVIIANSPRRVTLMRWGLIPHWAKDEKTAYNDDQCAGEDTDPTTGVPGPAEPPPLPRARLWLL